MDRRANPELDLYRPDGSASEAVPDEATARALQEENTRRAQATIVAIDRYIASVVRVLASGPGGIREAQRRAAALGLHRLQDYLHAVLTEMAQRTLGN